MDKRKGETYQFKGGAVAATIEPRGAITVFGHVHGAREFVKFTMTRADARDLWAWMNKHFKQAKTVRVHKTYWHSNASSNPPVIFAGEIAECGAQWKLGSREWEHVTCARCLKQQTGEVKDG